VIQWLRKLTRSTGRFVQEFRHQQHSPWDKETMVFTAQRVVITGGASGIGLALARSVARQGGHVILMGRNQDKLSRAAAVLGDAAQTHVLDVTDEHAVAERFADLSPFDHLVTAAAGTARGPLLELDVAEARALFDSKYWGQYHCVKYGAPKIKKGGSIVMFSGWISRKPAAGISTLASIDAAIEALARTLSLELAPIRVNAVSPGKINTPIWSGRFTPEEQQAFFADVGKSLPVGRAGTANDVAQALTYLLQNGFTTGAVLDVDGGQR
jgi:NAD(P)-dependent dehydrogenase (short-subunit alcohol dehydrogenase family)